VLRADLIVRCDRRNCHHRTHYPRCCACGLGGRAGLWSTTHTLGLLIAATAAYL
jgi:hypothetical protein